MFELLMEVLTKGGHSLIRAILFHGQAPSACRCC